MMVWNKGLLSNMAIFGKFLGCSSVVIGILWEPFATSPRSSCRGSYRSDVCRAAILAKEGGFYTDLDVVAWFLHS